MEDGSTAWREKRDSRPREQCLQSLGSAGTEWLREVGESLLWGGGVGGEQIVWILSGGLTRVGGQVVMVDILLGQTPRSQAGASQTLVLPLGLSEPVSSSVKWAQ